VSKNAYTPETTDMKVKIFVASAFLILVLNSCKQVEIKKHIPLINPQATEKTVKLYHFIQDIQGKHILSEEDDFVGKGSDYSDNWKKLQAKKAIIWGSDFSFCVEGEDKLRHQHCGSANLPAIPGDEAWPYEDFFPGIDYVDILAAV